MPRWLIFGTVIGVFELALLILVLAIRWLVGSRVSLWWYGLPIFVLGNLILVLGMVLRQEPWFMVAVFTLVLLWMFLMTTTVVFVAHKLTGSNYPVLFKTLLPVSFLALAAYAYNNAYSPVVRHYSITLVKPLAKPLRILVSSDLHLDYLVANKQIDKLAVLVKQEQPDIVLMPGDIINNDSAPYYKLQMQKNLQQITAPLGVWGTLGNHEFYGNLQENKVAIAEGGVKLLNDEAVVIDNSFVLVGRIDQTDKHRAALEKILTDSEVDPNLPVLVMDHRPYLTEAANAKVDLMVSGHTHNGQMFPANFIVKSMYELAYGYKQKGSSHFFTTSGFGFWGAPFRLGSRSEVFVIEVKGSN